MTGQSGVVLTPLSRRELSDWVVQHASVFDAGAAENPFACADWTLHFLHQVARDDWAFWLAGGLEPSHGFTLLYSSPDRPKEARALTNYYASLYSPSIGSMHADAESFAGLARQLLGAKPGFSMVDLAPMAVPQATAVQAGFRGARWVTRRYSCHGNWYLPCEGLGFDQYMAERPSQLLNTWRRKAKKFGRSTGDAHLQLATTLEQVDDAMHAFNTVYAKSWKKPEPYPHFVSEWAAICARRGWLRLGIAWVEGQPIAAQFWFTMNRRAYIFKLAYDESQAKWSAGTVLSAFLFAHSLEVDRVVEIDYLTGDDAYKQSWMTERRERVGVIACNPRTLAGLMRGAYESAGELRQRWRRASD